MPGSILSTRDTAVNSTTKVLSFVQLIPLRGEVTMSPDKEERGREQDHQLQIERILEARGLSLGSPQSRH